MDIAETETRTFAQSPQGSSGVAHIIRETEPKGYIAMMIQARPGSRWTYCGLDATDWKAVWTPLATPDRRICFRCDTAYFNDEEAD